MGFTLIKGTFHLNAGLPDRDSVRFMADDDRLFDEVIACEKWSIWVFWRRLPTQKFHPELSMS